jgi:hypothetical protein
LVNLWFYFTEKENFGYGFVKLIQELSSFGFKSTFVVLFILYDGLEVGTHTKVVPFGTHFADFRLLNSLIINISITIS